MGMDRVVLSATNQKALDSLNLDDLRKFAVDRDAVNGVNGVNGH